MNSVLAICIGAVGVPLLLFAWLGAVETAGGAIRIRRLRSTVRAGGWLLPAALIVAAVLVFPLLYSLVKSFFDSTGNRFIGLENYGWMFTNLGVLTTLKNNAIWVVLFTVLTTFFGLVVAIAADRVRYESVAKAIVIVPTAISLTATAVIWQQMYQFQPSGTKQTGTVSALTALIPGLGSQAWIQNPALGTYALIVAATWAHAGIATVILSSAVKAIPAELLEAARVDGASTVQVFRHVTLPQLWPTISVVGTIEVIYALKVFDIVYIMTGGLFGTDVVANHVYSELFLSSDLGKASALAILLSVMVTPVVAFNIRQMRK